MELDHIAFDVNDADKLIEFYTEIIGLEAERLEEFHTGQVPFPSVRINEYTIIDFIPNTESCVIKNANHICFALEQKEWQKLYDRLKQHVIQFEGPVTRWGAYGAGTAIYFSDPENNKIEVRHY